MGLTGKDKQLDVNGHSIPAYLAQAAGEAPGVLVLHAWWGLNPFFKQLCDRLAAEGFTALAPSLLLGKTASTIPEAERLIEIEEQNQDLLKAIVQAASRELIASSSGKLGVMGFSMGAYWSMVAAASQPEVKAVVLFYGAAFMDLGRTDLSVLGHFAEHDDYESLENVRQMESALNSAGILVQTYIYPGTHHWFMEADRPEYDSASAGLAWERTIDFLKKNLS